ncbi:hypothetical protein JCM1840_007374 [Sporobolomyces johnsonii]
MGRPTPEPAEFEHAVARMKISDELTTEQRDIPVDMGKLLPRIKQNAYPASPRAREAMKRCVDEFLDIGIAHLVVNYKVLNSATTPDAYPMPRIDETLYSLPFATPFGQFEYTQMPMGLRNAPTEFQRQMDSHFREEIRAGWISIYINDLLGRSLSFDEHLRHLERTFTIRQFGHRVSGVLLGIDDHKVAAVKEWRALANRNELHVPWQWTQPCQAAFEKLKSMLLDAPVLACLEQVQELDGVRHKVAVCYISRQLKPSEERYSMPQLECLAVVWAVEKLHIFLDGTPSRHMLRWQLAIQEYRGHMTIRHRPGKANGSADGLSRGPLPNNTSNPAADLSEDVEVRPDIIDGQAHWVVERIINERRPPLKRGSKNKTRVVEYLVKWEGRPNDSN